MRQGDIDSLDIGIGKQFIEGRAGFFDAVWVAAKFWALSSEREETATARAWGEPAIWLAMVAEMLPVPAKPH